MGFPYCCIPYEAGSKSLDDQSPSEKPSSLEWLSLLTRPGVGLKRLLLTGLVGLLILTTGIAFALSVSVSETLVEFARRRRLHGRCPQ
jgi:hypothetical protein